MMVIVYILAGIVTLIIALQLFIRLQSKFKKGKPVEGLTGNIGSAVRRGGKVLVYFFSPTCAACRQQTPVIDSLQKGSSNIFKVDVSKDASTALKLGVMGTPSTVIIDNGIIKEFFMGYVSKEKINNFLQ
jgi:thioredoxin 1